MKNLGLFCLLLTCVGLQSCKNNQSEKIIEAKKAEEPMSVQCYKALYEQDTLDLKINTFKNGEITGNMEMTIANMPKKVGEIVGEFRGDTLFASYTFTQGGYKEKTYKNPMAFLKRNNQLILGNGKIQTMMGASDFAKGEPIDFERVKYKFSAVDCNEK
ncbi:hypothetical protein H4V97_003052 [Flavobacterium sp. CG_23.5]|uniref:hypothetical protein n=1 Tax=unclassified Flavobacterium TaxID=196869 RepID=UPI0018CAEAB7|nr:MULTISPECIES: hypothetical protein [unclassified Flavobacterium]MBG6109700.1 hypothetical protein [Flavobacterium sp. CG_9.10]MBP2284734.1 hypothetical protein [Flavobacterium sp. CG_23.5]